MGSFDTYIPEPAVSWGAVLLFAVGAWLAGWVGGMGRGWGFMLDVFLVMAAGSALLRKAIREEI